MKTLIFLIICVLAAVATATSATGVKPNTVKAPNGGACAMCEFVVTYLENYVNGTEPQIVAAVEKVCTVIPGNFQPMCQGFIAAYGPEIIDYLLQQQPPAKLCSEFKLCNRLVATAVKAPKIARNNLECTFCQYVIQYADSYLNSSSSQAEVEAVLNKVCAMIPSPLSSECTLMVTLYFPVFVHNLMNNYTPAQACAAAHLCNTSRIVTVAAPPAPSNDLKCVACEYIISLVENQLSNNATDAQIVALLDKVCSYVPGALKNECDAIVTQYAPLIIQLILNDAPPATVCATLTLCKRTMVEAAATPVQKKITIATPQPNGLQCALCEWVISELEATLSSNATISEVESALGNVCKVIPVSLQSACVALVNQYAPAIISTFVNKEPANKLCAQIKLCGGASTAAAAPVAPAVSAPKATNGIQCAVCEWIMTELENQLGNNATQQQIENAVDKVCTILPVSVQSLCVNIVSQYAPAIISYLVAKESPSTICGQIKLCSASKLAAKIAAPLQKGLHNHKKIKALSRMTVTKVAATAAVAESSQFCGVCQAVAGYIESYIAQNSSTAAIIAAVQGACNYVPSSVQGECRAFLPFVAQDLIKLLLNKESPSTLCSQLGVCSASAVATVAKAAKISGGIICTVCQTAVNYADSYITKNSTTTEIEAVLDRVCSFLPAHLVSICNLMIEEYTPALAAELVQKYGNAAQTCKAVGACTSSSTASYVAPSRKHLKKISKKVATAVTIN